MIVKLQLSCSRFSFFALLNSEVTGPIFSKISHDVEDTFTKQYWTKLHQLLSFGKATYVDYKTETIFAVVEETLLW